MNRLKNLIHLLALLALLLGINAAPANAYQPVPTPNKLPGDFRNFQNFGSLGHQPAFQEELAASNSTGLEMIGHLGGVAYAVALEGVYAYMATGGELAILDISDPLHPVRVGYAAYASFAYPGHSPKDILLEKGYAYLIYGSDTVDIVSVSDPFHPSFVGSVNTPEMNGSYFSGMAVYGDYLYLIMGSELRIYSLAQPGQPQYVDSFSIHYVGGDYSFAISGHYAYILGFDYSNPGKSNLEILDLTRPEAPQLVGALPDLSGEALAVQGKYAYTIGVVYDGQGKASSLLETLDISNPGHPVLANTMQITPKDEYRLIATNLSLYAVPATFAYAPPPRNMLIFSLQDPGRPVLGGVLTLQDVALDLDVTPDSRYALLAEYRRGLRTIDIYDARHPLEVGSYDPASSAWYMGLGEDIAVISSGPQGIHSIDLSDPHNPKPLGFHPAWENALDLQVDGGYAYTAELNGGGIRVYDLSDPAQIVEVGSVAGSFSNMALSGGYLYAWRYGYGLLTVIDIHNPTRPVQAGVYDASFISDLALSGQRAYIANPRDGCRIVNFLDPEKPVEEGYCPVSDAVQIEISGGYAYMITSDFSLNYSLTIFDLSNPIAPVQVGAYAYHSLDYYWLRVYGDLAFLYQSYSPYLKVIDVSDPRSPRQVLETDYGGVSSVIRDGDRLYLGGFNGFSILRMVSSLSGRVTDASGYPASGVRVEASSGISTTSGTDGSYLFDNLPIGSYTITPTLSGFNFVPSNRSVVLPADDSHQDFTLLSEPVTITATPGITATLEYTGYQGDITHFEIPSRAFNQTAQVIVTPTVGTGLPAWAFTGLAFELAAQEGQSPILDFGAPLTLTIAYTDFDIRFITDENKLFLYRWSGMGWEDAATTCTPASVYTRNPSTNQISLPICQPGKYALYGPTHAILMPAVNMNSQ